MYILISFFYSLFISTIHFLLLFPLIFLVFQLLSFEALFPFSFPSSFLRVFSRTVFLFYHSITIKSLCCHDSTFPSHFFFSVSYFPLPVNGTTSNVFLLPVAPVHLPIYIYFLVQRTSFLTLYLPYPKPSLPSILSLSPSIPLYSWERGEQRIEG